MKSVTSLPGLFMVLLLYGGGGMQAQNHVEVVKNLQTFGSTTLDYRQRQVEIRDVRGTPYLTEEFKEGEVLMGQTLYQGIELRYNIYSDRFEVRLDGQIIELDPVKNSIDTVYYSGNKFVRRFLQPGKSKKLSYVAVIFTDGSCSLFKQYRINLNPARDAGAYSEPEPAEFVPVRPEFFLGRGEDHTLVKGARSIADFFSVDQKEVKSFLKSNELNTGSEEDLARICSHFSKEQDR